jgi:hypothetical protein
MKSLSREKSPLQKLHSKDYQGEWINVLLGQGKIDRRFIKPSLIFENPSGNAICLGNGKSRLNRKLTQIENANKRKILRYYNVIYGCNSIYKEWLPDFLVVSNQLLAAKLNEEYRDIAYSNQEISRRYPGFNFMPGGYRLDAGASAAYLAAFHGAKRVFLFGYDGQAQAGQNNNVYAGTEHYPGELDEVQDTNWIRNLKNVIITYNDVAFYRVTTNPEDRYKELLKLANYKPIHLNQFISLADL